MMGNESKQTRTDEPPESLIDVLIDQAKKDEDLINKMGEAVRRGDKKTVFTLARQLTGTPTGIVPCS